MLPQPTLISIRIPYFDSLIRQAVCVLIIGLASVYSTCVATAQDADTVIPQPMKPAVPDFVEAMPPAPDNGVLDLAEVFKTDEKQALVAKIKEFNDKENFQLYVVSYTFLYLDNANQRAQRHSEQWLAGRRGAVVVFDKGAAADAELGIAWRNTGELPDKTVEGMLLSAKAACDLQPNNTPSQTLRLATTELMTSYADIKPQVLEKQRVQRGVQWKIIAAVLAVMLGALALLNFTQRFQKKTEERESETYLFPHAEIASRYEAPYGGGVVVQMHYGGKPA